MKPGKLSNRGNYDGSSVTRRDLVRESHNVPLHDVSVSSWVIKGISHDKSRAPLLYISIKECPIFFVTIDTINTEVF